MPELRAVLDIATGEVVISEMTPEQQAEAEAMWRPQIIRTIKPGAFIRRMTQARRMAIRAAADAKAEDLFDLIRTSDVIDLDSDEVVEGVKHLIAKNLLSDREAEALLVNGAPEEAA